MHEISESNPTDEILEMFPLEIFLMPTSSLEDSLARLFQLQESEQDFPWMTPEGHSLLRCLDSQVKSQYLIFSLRMLKDSSITTKEEPSKSSSKVTVTPMSCRAWMTRAISSS